jgi:hypothetical protein
MNSKRSAKQFQRSRDYSENNEGSRTRCQTREDEVKTHEDSVANVPQGEWRLPLLLSAAIEFAKLGSSEREAAKKAHALLKECEKILQKEGATGSKPMATKTKQQALFLKGQPGLPPKDPPFDDYFGNYVPWEEGIVLITGEARRDRAEEKLRMFQKTRLSETELADTLANLQKNGFPAGQIETQKEQFQLWWENEKSKKSTESGKKSATRRKNKPVPKPVSIPKTVPIPGPAATHPVQ